MALKNDWLLTAINSANFLLFNFYLRINLYTALLNDFCVLITMTTINPTHMSPADNKILFDFLSSQPSKNRLWKAGTRYQTCKNNASEIVLTHDVLWRKRKDKKEGRRYEVLTTHIVGEGGMGVVYDVAGTLALDKKMLEFKEQKRRVVKVQTHLEKKSLVELQKEYKLTAQAGHMAVKEPTVILDKNLTKNTSYLVMKKIKGICLLDVIIHDRAGKTVLTTKQRFELSIALLKALKEQVSNRGLIHRDIKPENILVHFTVPITVTIIDYGLSLATTARFDKKASGTPNYAAPEIYDTKPLTISCDMFSMARVLGLLWRDDDRFYTFDIRKARDYAKKVTYDQLFKNINDLTDQHKACIQRILSTMSIKQPVLRPAVEEALLTFETIAEEYNAQPGNIPVNSRKDNTPLNDIRAAIDQKLDRIMYHICTLDNKALDLNQRGYIELSEKLAKLATTLENKTNHFREQSITYQKCHIRLFAHECITQLNDIKPEISQHRNSNYLWANLALAIAGLVLFYLIAIAINKGINNHFLFFSRTETKGLSDNLKEECKSIPAEVPGLSC